MDAFKAALDNLARNAVARSCETARSTQGFGGAAMASLSANTLTMAVQGVNAEIRRLEDSVNGGLTELDPDDQELLLAFSRAAMELKAVYLEMSRTTPGMPPYEQLVEVGPGD